MRNLKKFLALVLAMIMVVSAAAVVSADFTDVPADNRYAAAINDLAVKGIVKGTSETTFGPSQKVTREQMALFVARSITGELDDAAYANGIVPFTDVTNYKGAIQCAYLNGIINGTSATTFAPKDGITYVAALKMAVCALGYGEGLEWPWGYYNKAAELGLTANMDIDTLEAELNRAETAQVIYNMIYAARKDSDKSFAAEKFAIGLPESTTVFVITATPKQYYFNSYKSSNDVGKDLVGVQKLVNGIPSGDMVYVEMADLGIAKADVEKYFNYAVELINYNEETKEFDRAELLTEGVKVVNQTGASYSSKKLKIDGTTYTAVDAFTGSSLLNEIVVFNSTDISGDAKMLLINKDGDVIDGKGNILAVFAYESSTGVKYYYDKIGGKDVVISESKALEEHGVKITNEEAASFVKYDTLTTADDDLKAPMNGQAFQLQLFDDDLDGKYERAYYAPIYMSVYYTYKGVVSSSEVDCDGILQNVYGLKNKKAADVTYTNAAAKKVGAVSVFTYNSQLNQVNVIDVLEMQTGEVDKINSTKYNTGGYGDIVVTVDGKEYKIGYDLDGKWGTWVSGKTTDGATLGATLVPYDASSTNKYGVEDVADRPFIQYIANRVNWIDDLKIGDEIGFYVYNNIIVYASELEVADAEYKFTVVEDFADFDLAEIYLDLWVDGEVEDEALVVAMNGKDLEDLSSYKFSMLLSEKENFYTGTIYAYTNADDAYDLEEIIDEDNYDEYDLIDAKVADDEYAADDTKTDGTIAFDDGSTRGDRANRLRTNASTIFYFIERAACSDDTDNSWDCTADEHHDKCDYNDPELWTVRVFEGQPDDATIDFDADTKIWADKLGHGDEDYNGRASVVFVIDPVDHDGFFGVTDTVYVMTNLNMQYTEVDSAEDLGMPEDYSGVYYKYANGAVDMNTGDRITIYSKVKVYGNRIYKVDENGVVYLKDEYAYTDKNGKNPFELKDANEQGNHNNDTYKLHWGSSQVIDFLQDNKNYVAYGITDVNGATTSVKDTDKWGKPDSKLNYNDFVWYTKANTQERNAALDEYAAELAALVNAAIDAGSEDVDVSTIVNSNDNQAAVKAFLKPYVEAGKKIDADDIEFEEIPTKNYEEIELVNPIVYAEYVDDYVTIELLKKTTRGVEADTFLVDENDRITDLIVVSATSIGTKFTGEDAIAILNTAPQIAWIGTKGAENVYGELYDEYTKDGSIVIAVLWQHADK